MPSPRLLRGLLPLLLLLPAPAPARDRGELTILSYHEIADPADAVSPAYAVGPTSFLRQMDWLRNHGYRFVGVATSTPSTRPLGTVTALMTI